MVVYIKEEEEEEEAEEAEEEAKKEEEEEEEKSFRDVAIRVLRGYGRKIHGSSKTKDENEKLSAVQYDAMRCDVVWYATVRYGESRVKINGFHLIGSSSRDDDDDDDDKDENGDGAVANLRKPNENRDGIRERWIYYPERDDCRPPVANMAQLRSTGMSRVTTFSSILLANSNDHLRCTIHGEDCELPRKKRKEKKSNLVGLL
ncbi:hypothetical protein V1477_017340, partial [Vespula maculifrons]